MTPTKNDAERRRALEAKVLQNLLSTPPRPKVAKKVEGDRPKKRGRPPKKQDA